jgi:hypothetical protein
MAFLSAALERLRDEVDALAPNRSTASDGWLGDPAHAARDSDHNAEPDGSVDAVDLTHDPAHGADMNKITDEAKDDPRMDAPGSYIIWNRRIWSGQSWVTYTGSNPHTLHAHFSIGDSVQHDSSDWLGEGEEDVTADDLQAIRTIVQNNREQVQETIKNAEARIKSEVEQESRATRRAILDYEEAVVSVTGANKAAIRAKLQPATLQIINVVD